MLVQTCYFSDLNCVIFIKARSQNLEISTHSTTYLRLPFFLHRIGCFSQLYLNNYVTLSFALAKLNVLKYGILVTGTIKNILFIGLISRFIN